MPRPPVDRSQVLDHLGLVAGMCAERGMGEVMDHATHQHPERRLVTTGHAVKAMVLNGRGCVHPQRSLIPPCFHHQPTSRLIAPAVAPEPLHDETRGRAFETLYAYGVTARSRLMAATAAPRLGWSPTLAPLESPSFPVDGRDNSDEAPSAQVMHLTRGSSRDQRPDLHHVMLELSVEPQAGIAVLMQPRSGKSRDAQEFGPGLRAHLEPLQPTYGTTSGVAASARYRADTLPHRAHTDLPWITRVPATLSEAQAALAQADPQAMAALREGDRAPEVTSTSGGVAPRGLLISSAPRQAQAQRTVATPRRQPSDTAVNTGTKRCRTALACEAEARQALATLEPGRQATCLEKRPVRATPRAGKRGRPGPDAQPDQVVYPIAAALAASRAVRQARVDQPSGFLLATKALDATHLPPQELWQGDNGQGPAERGWRFLKDPRVLASSLSLTKPERSMAWRMVRTVCLWVYAALAYRLRTVRKEEQATFPDHKSQPMQTPTARWVLPYVVGIHLLRIPGQWPLGLNLPEEHPQLLQLLGKSSERFYR
jgi:transposase